MASLSFDYVSLVVAGAGIVIFWLLGLGKNGGRALLYFSDLKDLQRPSRWLAGWAKLPDVLRSVSLVFLALAFADPHFFVERGEGSALPVPTEGVAIYLTLDKSGSMAEEVVTRSSQGGRMKVSKMDLLKSVTASFVNERPNDMVGIVSFARQADVMAPLTLDHGSVLESLAALQNVPDKQLDGTAIGYAIYKTANLIKAAEHYSQDARGGGKPAYEIKNGVIVLVTDGFQDPNPLDYGNANRTMGVEEAAKYAKEQGVRLYIVNVEPKMNSREFTPHRNLMQRAAESTGGRFFQADSGESLGEIYGEINAMEKGKLPGAKHQLLQYDRVSLYPFLIAAGMVCLLVSIFLSTTLARRMP